MVFSNLRGDEKEAFFGLLDEYFTSRPEVLAHLAAQSSGSTPSAVASKAASAVQRAVASKPDIASRFTPSAARHQATPSTTANQGNDTNEDEDEQPVSVAARMAAFASKHASQPPPGRGPPPVAPKPSTSGLVTSKTFGGIDTTSTRNALGSIYANRSGAKPAEPPQPPPAPPAFPKRNNFAPPPSRGAASATPPPPPPRAPSPPPPEPEEEEEQGEWAEALYAYSSNEPADLSFNEDDRILIVERTSDDWWTGECNGRRGLLPASYVKLL